MANAKNIEDKLRIEKDQIEASIATMIAEKKDSQCQLGKVLNERDRYRLELKELADLKQKLEREKKHLKATNEVEVVCLKRKITELVARNNDQANEISKLTMKITQ